MVVLVAVGVGVAVALSVTCANIVFAITARVNKVNNTPQ